MEVAANSPIGRRRFVGLLGSALAGGGLLLGCTPDVPARRKDAEPEKIPYGPDAAQYGELYLPSGTRRAGTLVVIHGGFWRAEYGADLGDAISSDLAKRGWATWNLEYRRVGNGGGWPQTFADVAAGLDHLRKIPEARRLDLSSVVVIGHSAGGHLATWLAGRPRLPNGAPGADPALRVSGVVSQAGLVALTSAAEEGIGSSAVPDLMGGPPNEVDARYVIGDPIRQLPTGVPVRCVHGRADLAVPFEQSSRYVRAARAAGDDAQLVEVPGDHFALIGPTSPAWARIVDLLPSLVTA